MLDERVRFKYETVTEQDEDGETETHSSYYEAYAEVKAPTRTEFYQASQAGFKASAVIKVYRDFYDGAPFVVISGKLHKIIRSYPVNSLFVELTCEEVL